MPAYTWRFDVVWDAKIGLLRGALVTLELTVFAMAIGLVIALVVSLAHISKRPYLHYPAVGWVEFFRGIPVLVVLVWVYYCLPLLLGYNINKFLGAVLSLSVSESAYLAEIMRAGIQSIDKGQVEAGRSLGMSSWQTMRRIVLPQALRRMVPPFVNDFAALIKYSSLASIVTVYELLFQGQNIIHNTFRPLEVYTTIAIVYFAMTFPVTRMSVLLESRLGKLRT